MKLKITKKTTLLASLVMLSALLLGNYKKTFAQGPASLYGFTAISGTYTPITGGTGVAAVQTDDGTSAAINIGFNFNYCGTVYTQIKANANCWITFNTATTSTQWTNTLANLTTEQIKPALLPFWDDVAGWVLGANASNASYLLTGTAPNRVFTFQYTNWQFPRNGQTSPPTYNLQVKLYETTNVIEYIYDRIPPVTTGFSGVTIGIADGTAVPTYLTLNNSSATPVASSTTFTTTINDLPAAGQIYRFTPPTPCATTANLPTTGTVTGTPGVFCLSGNVTLNFTPNIVMPPLTGITYKWQTCPTVGGVYIDIPGAVTNTPTYTTTVPITASAFFKCVVLCNTTNIVLTSTASAQVVVNNPGNPTGVPAARCGPGSVALSVTPPAATPGATFNWYTAATGGTSVFTGANYNTPYITSNANFYVTANANGCEGNRVAVLATVNTSAVVAKTAPAVVCNNSIATISLTPPTPAYPSYNWTPFTNLYTDAAATIPYTGGSATNVYMKTTNVGTQTYYLMAGNPLLTTGCTYADTVKIWVQPQNVTIKGNPDTICITGSTILKLDTIDGYFPGSIQWQTSTDNIFYPNIAGATAPTYVTPVLNFGQNTYYRAIITAGAATCQSPVKYVVIANPVLLSAPDSFNCGPGTVTLNAATGGNSVPVWYTVPSGGTPIASGNPFVTPYLGATTSYYVVAGAGGPSGVVAVGAGALVSTSGVNPYVANWGGTKSQYIIRATELAALGIPAGATIRSIALDVVAGGVPYPGFAISMKNTTSTTVTNVFELGLTEAFAPTNITTTAGLNTYTLSTPFVWTGANLLIQTCWSNGTGTAVGSTVRADNTTYASTHKAQSDNLTPSNMCSVVGANAGTNTTPFTQRPKFILSYDKRCESAREEVIAHIYPKPVVNLGTNINQCVDLGTSIVLDAGLQPNTPQFLWDDNSTLQVRSVSESGNYSVKVTNMYTCSDTDTVSVILRPNPVINLGNDTTVCNGVILTLNPGGNGTQYFWSTGGLQQTITINSPGTYNVFVTNAVGCMSADTIVVTMQGELPSVQDIQISNNNGYTFTFTAVNPQNVIGYEWDFGDGSAPSYEVSPVHTYPNASNYTVVLRLSSTCGFLSDTLSAHIVGIRQINVSNEDLNIYPNPTKNTATIAINGNLKMEKVEVYNVLGQLLYKKKADSQTKHVLSLDAMASGIYTIQIYTDKGSVSRKLEILK